MNGGGQLKTAAVALTGVGTGAGSQGTAGVGSGGSSRESPAEVRARVAAVEEIIHSGATVRRPELSPLVAYLAAAQPLHLHTRYHAVPKLEVMAPLVAKW